MLAGAVGLVTSITYAWLSAPDLALTQLAVEVVTLVLILLGLRWLPPRIDEYPGPTALRTLVRRFCDLAVALLGGGGLALLAYVMMTRPAPDGISGFFEQQAMPLGGGAHVGNRSEEGRGG